MLQLENKKRVAILVGANIYNRKGLFNAVHERIRHLKDIADYQIDAFIISTYKSSMVSVITRSARLERPEWADIDGIHYRVLWMKKSVLGWLLVHKLHRKDTFIAHSFRKYIPLFKEYDLLEGHTCGEYVRQIHDEYGMPYLMTWHGSDIHTAPFQLEVFLYSTKEVLENAAHNFFVSKALMDLSDKITTKGSKSVLYNGRDERFVKYPQEHRDRLRRRYNVEGKKVVAFVGNLIPVKNITALPGIFKVITAKCLEVVYWIIGDGTLRTTLENATNGLPMDFWGNVEYSIIPDLMNVIDVLVLPSLNEGLPLVTVEALSCGCNVVGSRVGGIAEAIGEENTIPLDSPNFETLFAERCVAHIKGPGEQVLKDVFDWKKSAVRENEVIKDILK